MSQNVANDYCNVFAIRIAIYILTTTLILQVLNRSLDPRTPSELSDSNLSPLISHLPTSPLPGVILPQQLITSGTQRDCIRLRGLPFEASVTDILTFLGEHSRNIVFQGVHMVYNAQVCSTNSSIYDVAFASHAMPIDVIINMVCWIFTACAKLLRLPTSFSTDRG